MRPERFSIDIDETVLGDLRDRVRRTRWPGPAPGEPRGQGTSAGRPRSPTSRANFVSEGDFAAEEPERLARDLAACFGELRE